MNKINNLLQILFGCFFLIFFNKTAKAQIIPDNTLGAKASRITPNVLINGVNADRIDGGAQRGINLFHSFSEFNIEDGQRVYFGNPSLVENIFSRITGNSASDIFGVLGVDGNANLFLINPNGILFGENSSLDVGGSFVGTTANSIQFGEQGVFSTTNPEAPPLLTIEPNLLRFNRINRNAAVQNNSRVFAGQNLSGGDAFGLRVPDGKSLLLLGGNVSMDGGGLNAFGGRVELGGLAEAGTVGLDINEDIFGLVFPDGLERANIFLANNSRIDTVASGGGSIAVNARNVNISGVSLMITGIGQNLGSVDSKAGDININATGEINITDFASGIVNLVGTDAQGNGGDININAGSFNLENGAEVTSSTFGKGNAGNVRITAKNAISVSDAYIFSTLAAGGVGKGGNIEINGATLSLQNGAQLLTAVREAFDNQPAGKGDAGNVNVNIAGAVDVSGKRDMFYTTISTEVQTGTEGNGGDININSGSFNLGDGAEIASSTSGKGNAGNVTLTAKDTVSFTGGNIFSTVGAGGVGKGGNININAANLSIRDGSQLLTSTSGASDSQMVDKSDAGNVNINVSGLVDIIGVENRFPSGIRSGVGTEAEGNGGNITVNAGHFNLRDGAQLITSTSGKGNAGNVTLTAKNEVLLSGDSRINSDVGAFCYRKRSRH